MAYDQSMDKAPNDANLWLRLTHELLELSEASTWAVLPNCGAVVAFCGTARDHNISRGGVQRLEYEAYERYVLPKLDAIASEMRQRWPEIVRIVLWHRIGEVSLTESSVVVVVSAPHRPAAFDAARFAIDTLKATAPIWKREVYPESAEWVFEPDRKPDGSTDGKPESKPDGKPHTTNE